MVNWFGGISDFWSALTGWSVVNPIVPQTPIVVQNPIQPYTPPSGGTGLVDLLIGGDTQKTIQTVAIAAVIVGAIYLMSGKK
jgi:hypothetical protein